MDLIEKASAVYDPVEQLNDVLRGTWNLLCCTYDAYAGLPDIETIFGESKLAGTYQIAQDVLVNMLLELMENIGRFSPWYTRPARAFGLMELRQSPETSRQEKQDTQNSESRTQNWVLAPEAILRWQPVLADLSKVIEKTYPFIQAILLVDGLMDQVGPGEEWITASCKCRPARMIQVTQLILDRGEIRCNVCFQAFKVFPEYPTPR